MLSIHSLLQHYIYDGTLPEPNPPGYQYIMAGNGIFVQADNPLRRVVVQIVRTQIKGLPALQQQFMLKHHRLNGRTLPVIIEHARQRLDIEVVYHVTADLRIHAIATGTKSAVEFENVPDEGVILEAHSHNTMPAGFSSVDNKYEQRFRFYMVVGNLHGRPQVAFRLGVYGYHIPLPLSVLFDFSNVNIEWDEVSHAQDRY